jgi:hypothetical protein
MLAPRNDLYLNAFLSTAEAVGEIAAMAPMVVWIRSDAFMASMIDPLNFDGGESMLMVTEKLAALAEGAVHATMTAGAGVGSAMMTGMAQPDLGFRIADAAVQPMRRRVNDNYRRLTQTRYS